ncbi:hypothetical protein [Mycoplasmoides alvi]|uniref:hypothetical protein n=1 Tax=Mycoplasmoides alvi TaxID=78580 RepID=UPI00051C6E93|nr:hypothetical protein [Mycoplasmoides alvi]
MQLNCKNKCNIQQHDKEKILKEIAKEISAIKKERDLSLDLLQKNLNNRDYKTITIHHYNLKINKLKNELELLKSKLNDKESNAAKKISNLIENYKTNFDEILMQINIAFDSIQIKYDFLKESNFSSIEDLDILLSKINEFKKEFKISWFSNLENLSKKLFLVISQANSRILKKIFQFVIDNIPSSDPIDILSTDIIVKRYIQNCINKICDYYDRVSGLYNYLSNIKSNAIENEKRIKKEKEFWNEDVSPILLSSDKDTESLNNKLSSEIENVKKVVEKEISDIRKDNLERESRWQIFLENECSKHEKLLNDIRDDYHDSLVKERQNMLLKINNAIEDHSQKIIDSEASDNDLEDIYKKITNDHKLIMKENFKNKNNVLKDHFVSINDEIEKQIDTKLEELNNKNLHLEEQKDYYLKLLKDKINAIRVSSQCGNKYFDVSEKKELNNDILINENFNSDFIKDEENNLTSFESNVQNNDELIQNIKNSQDDDSPSIIDVPNNTLNNLANSKEDLNNLTDEITKRIVNKFNEEIEKICYQNNMISSSMNPCLDLNNLNLDLLQQQDPNQFAQFMNNMNLFNDFNNPINGNYHTDSSFKNNLNQQQIHDNVDNNHDGNNIDSQIMSRKVKFVGFDKNNSRHGRLSSEDIRKYANSIISANRKKNIKE